MDEDAKRLRSSETSTRRDMGMETSVSRSEACTNRSIASISQHDGNISTRTTPVRRTVPPSPKTIQIEMMMEKREEQERALEQIEDCYKETRLWWALFGSVNWHFDAYYCSPECSNCINETCFRRHHFYWCTAHGKITDGNGLCPKTPSENASRDIMRCSEVRCGLCIPSPNKNSVLGHSNCDPQIRPRRKHIGRKLKKTHSQEEQDFETRENLMFIRRRRLHDNCKIGQLSWKGVFNLAFIYLQTIATKMRRSAKSSLPKWPSNSARPVREQLILTAFIFIPLPTSGC